MAVGFRLLGGVEAQVDGQSVDLGHARRQCVLAVLLIEANQAVSAEQLIDRVWAANPPNRARNALHGYLGRLRNALADAPGVEIIRTQGGYVLSVDEQAVDLHQFRLLLTQARAADDERALELYEQAFALWQGEAFAGLESDWLAAVRAGLDAERLAAELDHTDVRLRCGNHAELLPQLSAQADLRPLDERLAAQLMLALYRGGRQAEALQHYERTRQQLAEELGTDPSAALQELHQQILRADQALAHPAEVAPRSDLPGDVADFTGRTGELRQLLTAAQGGATVVISAIDGMAGIGKTTLALRAAHHLAGSYPDGQLFLDLHGHTEGRRPVEPATALASLLRAVGVAREQIPDTVEERASRWRAELARRKVLVVLDNAAAAAQVRPLLPGSAGSLTLITSRRRLADLDTTCSLSLELLPVADAIALFTRVAGQQRAEAETGAVAQVARLCGYLPLALRIAAARLRTRPAWSVAHLAERLGDEQRRLGELSAGDRSVAAAFTLSYDNLDAARQRLFRLLGLVPGPHWDAYLAAAMTGTSVADAEDSLEQLLDVHLLTQPAPGRYQLHDLLAEHAAAVARKDEPAANREAVIARLVSYYCSAGARALELGAPIPGITDRPFQSTATTAELPKFATNEQALAWLKTERPNLHAAQQLGPGTLPVRLDLLTVLAFSQCLGGHGAEGLRTTRQLLELTPDDDLTRRVTAVLLCATVEGMFGWADAGKALLRAELGRLPGPPTFETAPLHLRLAIEHVVTGEAAESSQLLDELEASEVAEGMRYAIAVARAMGAYLTGDVPRLLSQIDLAESLMRELSREELLLWIDASAQLAWAEVKAGRLHSGLSRMDETIAAAATGSRNYVLDNHIVAFLSGTKAITLGRLGRLAEAAALAADAVDLARQVDLPETLTMAISAQSLVLAWAGDHHRARRNGLEAARLAEARQDWTSIVARATPGLASLYAEDLDAGRNSVQAACDEHEFVVGDETMTLILLEALAHAAAAKGRSGLAAEWADRAERVRHPAHATNAAMADLIRAHSLTSGDPARAADLARRAAETLGSAGLRLDEGRARLRAGLSLTSSGRPEHALAELTAAVKLFNACGARELHSQAIAARRLSTVDLHAAALPELS